MCACVRAFTGRVWRISTRHDFLCICIHAGRCLRVAVLRSDPKPIYKAALARFVSGYGVVCVCVCVSKSKSEFGTVLKVAVLLGQTPALRQRLLQEPAEAGWTVEFLCGLSPG